MKPTEYTSTVSSFHSGLEIQRGVFFISYDDFVVRRVWKSVNGILDKKVDITIRMSKYKDLFRILMGIELSSDLTVIEYEKWYVIVLEVL